ncbi:hypothetical protein CAPTEDRAFT_201726 [Capitella teleta]|uniref:LRRCT domain-containing protein n=1 Tax=Capitella teleta TaxID=283909 RepID=R7U7C1_CAPTE|nr:hypothetical protein CAPTEDRAFT_201726 [Capitella teleta]|eukprot:ELT99571.1 hypothetical protein CAPTEDRAFT_201726 [Capitella teleta]
MSKAAMLLSWAALSCCFLTAETAVPTVTLNSSGLVEVPQNIPNDTRYAYLDLNRISIVRNDAFSYLPELTRLYLDRNRIDTIEDHAFHGTILRQISMQFNQLKWFPNLTDVRHSLTTVWINSNRLKFIRAEQVEGLTALEALFIGGNVIYSLLDFSILHSLNDIGALGMDIQCCNKVISLKSLNNTSLKIKPSPCTYPEELVDVDWQSITRDHMSKPCPGQRDKNIVMQVHNGANDRYPDVFVNKELTKLQATLLYKARLLKRASKISRVWSRDGRILVMDKNSNSSGLFAKRPCVLHTTCAVESYKEM